jgi:hypothetical protein
MKIPLTLHSAVFSAVMAGVYVGTKYYMRGFAEEEKERQRQMQIRRRRLRRGPQDRLLVCYVHRDRRRLDA